ncbi:hypothetical protein [Nostoc sp. FACHB-280]|uniref:hypothetical protein n=1 Tax=Nostoc sp. FACHB-280 TaxID=2692839 RepID=UPI00168A4834|nr:hypothetical protein [Nostoc sp. FACHB-280]MBD2492871.1 hypothetical protein [Nostoc sp. FACHB-280]
MILNSAVYDGDRCLPSWCASIPLFTLLIYPANSCMEVPNRDFLYLEVQEVR